MMIYELRSYTLRPGGVPAYVELFGGKGLPLLSRYATLVGYFHVETGNRLNRIVHVWRYESRAHRLAQRTALMAEPEWRKGFLPEAMPHLLEQHSSLIQPTPGSIDPLAWAARHPRPVSGARLYELHTWHTAPGSIRSFLGVLSQEQVLLARHIEVVATWHAASGELGRVLQLRAVADEADRDAREAALDADPGFARFLRESGPMLRGEDSEMLVPAAYSPLT